MSTICVKFDGKVTRVTGTAFRFVTDRVYVYDGLKLVASLHGYEAWIESSIPERDMAAGFTGYYIKGVTIHYASPVKYIANGKVVFTIVSSGCSSALRTHEEWVALGYIPITRIDH